MDVTGLISPELVTQVYNSRNEEDWMYSINLYLSVVSRLSYRLLIVWISAWHQDDAFETSIQLCLNWNDLLESSTANKDIWDMQEIYTHKGLIWKSDQ